MARGMGGVAWGLRRGGGASGALFWGAAIVLAAGTIAAMAMFASVAKRKGEASHAVLRIVEIGEGTVDPAEWGKNFPRQYDGFVRTADNARAMFRWSQSRPAGAPDAAYWGDAASGTPGPGDSGPAESKLAGDPLLRTIFNGYAFAIDYRERRGHAYMLHDQRETQRVKQKPQPGACLNCHASNVVAYRRAGLEAGAPGSLGDGLLSEHGRAQLFAGWEKVNPMSYDEATQLVGHAISCLDCHDPGTMALRITRPAFLEGVAALARSDDPVAHFPSVEKWRREGRKGEYDPNALASRQEMRSMVCGQCHVEYYFKGEGKRLTFPWHNGLKAGQMEAYYDDAGYSDWTHKDSGAGVLKAQHPEFELWSQGIHARSGVSCADCHMPYKREGAMKFSDHQVQTPMANVNRSCQVCHAQAEGELVSRVEQIQGRTKAQLDRAEAALVELIVAIGAAAEAGAGEGELRAARDLQRRAQWRADLINAENSMGFHAPGEALLILGEAIDYARQGVAEVMRVRAAPRSAGGASRPTGTR